MAQPKWQGQGSSGVVGDLSFFERLRSRLQQFLGVQETLTRTGKHMESNEWKVLVKFYGMLEAQALIGRLQAEGIPAQAWQEGAGKALGITVGYLGEIRVVVPSQFYEEAKEIADKDFSEEVELDEWDHEEWADEDVDEG